MLVLLLAACSGKCVPTGVAGVYSLTVSGTEYRLRLSPGGGGALSSQGRESGSLNWELVDGSQGQMLELTASGDVFTLLQQLSLPKNQQREAAQGTRGAFESFPHCSRAGILEKLVVNYNSGTGFDRQNAGP